MHMTLSAVLGTRCVPTFLPASISHLCRSLKNPPQGQGFEP